MITKLKTFYVICNPMTFGSIGTKKKYKVISKARNFRNQKVIVVDLIW